jgi:hypothetical protein
MATEGLASTAAWQNYKSCQCGVWATFPRDGSGIRNMQK